jgi:hypothetical protein
MNKSTVVLAQSLVVAMLFAVQAPTEEEEALKKDLTAVIALHGLPCGQVIAVKVQAESDYAASCQDGNRYRVYMTAEGRVVVGNRSLAQTPSRL